MPQGLAPLFAVALIAALAAGAFVAAGRPASEVPIADINHALHIEQGLECVDCHTGVDRAAPAGVPGIAICADCHDDPEDSIARSENGKLILAHVAQHQEPWWPRYASLPADVVFSHRRHVVLGGVACKRCHGEMERTTTLPEEPLRAAPRMEECLDCHQRSGASLDCFSCHK